MSGDSILFKNWLLLVEEKFQATPTKKGLATSWTLFGGPSSLLCGISPSPLDSSLIQLGGVRD